MIDSKTEVFPDGPRAARLGIVSRVGSSPDGPRAARLGIDSKVGFFPDGPRAARLGGLGASGARWEASSSSSLCKSN